MASPELFAALLLALSVGCAAGAPLPQWKHLSSKEGDLPVPNGGTQQTACVVFDIDKDGRADIVLAERTQAPAIVWLRPTADGWEKYVIDDTLQLIARTVHRITPGRCAPRDPGRSKPHPRLAYRAGAA